MSFKTTAGITVGKLGNLAISLIAKNRGTNWAGETAMRIDPELIAHIKGIDADKVNVSVAGSGDWDASRIESEDLNIVVSGSGDVEIADVDIDGSLNATVKGSGDIDVSGYASNVVASVSGSGDISGRLKYDNITKSRSGSGDIDW